MGAEPQHDEKFMGVLWRVGYFGPNPKPGSGVVPLPAALRYLCCVLTQKNPTANPDKILQGKKKKKIK